MNVCVSFSPKPPAPPPPAEPAWSTVPSAVKHLTEANFTATLAKKDGALVMFYAPWCGHCKKAKPEFQAAADAWKDKKNIIYAAVDCTSNRGKNTCGWCACGLTKIKSAKSDLAYKCLAHSAVIMSFIPEVLLRTFLRTCYE